MVAMPTWDQFMAPVLRVLRDGQVRRRRELYGIVADEERLSDEQRADVLSSGQFRYENRIGWATSYLTRVGALERPARGQYVITDVGRQLLRDHPNRIAERDLRVLAGDADAPQTWQALKVTERGAAEAQVEVDLDPTEQLEQGIARIHAEVAADLLTRLHGKDRPSSSMQS